MLIDRLTLAENFRLLIKPPWQNRNAQLSCIAIDRGLLDSWDIYSTQIKSYKYRWKL